MQHHIHTSIHSDLVRVTFAIEECHGFCDPAFDNDLEELERQFADFRLDLANDFN